MIYTRLKANNISRIYWCEFEVSILALFVEIGGLSQRRRFTDPLAH